MADIFDSIDASLGGKQDEPLRIEIRGNAASKPKLPDAWEPIIQASAAQYKVNPDVLRGILTTESGGNANAVSNKGAKGPAQLSDPTAKALGVTDPFDPAQAIPAMAKLHRENLDATGGDETQALMRYHGGTDQKNWGPLTKAYPGKVLGVAGQQPAQQQGYQGNFDPDAIISSIDNAKDVPIAETKSNTDTKAPPNPNKPTVAQLYAARATPAEKNLLKSTASLADTAYGVVPAVVGGATYMASRGLSALGKIPGLGDIPALNQTPEQSQQVANTVSSAIDNPVGKAFGITEDPAYKGEASRQVMGFVGKNMDKGSQWIADRTGLPKGDVDIMLQSAIPEATRVGGGAVAGAARPVINAAKNVSDTVKQWHSEIPESAPVPENAAPQLRVVTGHGAAQVNPNPYPVMSGEVTARGGDFPIIKRSQIPGDVHPDEQSIRHEVASEITGNGQVRQGVVTGNEDTLRNEHTTAKLAGPDDPKANVLRAQIADEQKGLTNYAQDRVSATGASDHLDTAERRGDFLNNVIHGEGGVTGWLKDQWNDLYSKARATVGNNPVSTPTLQAALTDPATAATLESLGKPHVATGVAKLVDLANTTGFKNMDGTVAAPGSIGALEVVRQKLNSLIDASDPATAAHIRQFRDALDNDVGAAGGAGTFEQARALYRAGKNIFDSPGIKSLFGEKDINGVVVSKTPVDKIMAKINNLPTDQWQHIYETFDSLSKGKIPGAPEGTQIPAHIQTMAEQAKREMAGNLTREVYEKGAKNNGVWSQHSANATMNRLQSKLQIALPPDEMARMHTLNLGGQFMPGEHAYEGAAQQFNRMNQPNFIEKSLPTIGAMAGGKTGIPGGAYLGGKLGEILAGKSAGKNRENQALSLREQMRLPPDQRKRAK